jgi:hypothetical protein
VVSAVNWPVWDAPTLVAEQGKLLLLSKAQSVKEIHGNIRNHGATNTGVQEACHRQAQLEPRPPPRRTRQDNLHRRHGTVEVPMGTVSKYGDERFRYGAWAQAFRENAKLLR